MRAPMNRDELIALVQRVIRMDYANDDECNQLIEELQRQVLDPQVCDYIYWPDREMTAADIVDRALAYQPTVLSWTEEQ